MAVEIFSYQNSWPDHWYSGRFSRIIFHLVEHKIRSQVPGGRVLLIDPTWNHCDNIRKRILEHRPDFVVIFNVLDPLIPGVHDVMSEFQIPWVELGCATTYSFDFWAMVCGSYFKSYNYSDLILEPNAKHFVCYNRNPHFHRTKFVELLKQYEVFDQGYVSLGLPGKDVLIVDRQPESNHHASDHPDVSVDIKSDTFSLGDLGVWRKSLYCFVTETVFESTKQFDFFVSEKTYKPIIGLRPFLLYGQSKLRNYLTKQGFDLFEDIFDYSLVDETSQNWQQMMSYGEIAAKAVRDTGDPQETFQHLLPRLKSNRQRFGSYASEQWDKINDLDFNKILMDKIA